MAKLRRGWLWALLVVVFVAILVGAGTAWQFHRSHDPFASLEDHDHDPGELGGVDSTQVPRLSSAAAAEQLRQLDEQLHRDPNNPGLLSKKIHLGLEYSPQAAAQECRRLLERSPDNYFALHHAAMAFLAMGDLDRAMHFAARALQARDTAEAHFIVGHIFYAKSDFASALNHYRTALARNPNDDAARGYVLKAEKALAARSGNPSTGTPERRRLDIGRKTR